MFFRSIYLNFLYSSFLTLIFSAIRKARGGGQGGKGFGTNRNQTKKRNKYGNIEKADKIDSSER
jgi:hypothetical protein